MQTVHINNVNIHTETPPPHIPDISFAQAFGNVFGNFTNNASEVHIFWIHVFGIYNLWISAYFRLSIWVGCGNLIDDETNWRFRYNNVSISAHFTVLSGKVTD